MIDSGADDNFITTRLYPRGSLVAARRSYGLWGGEAEAYGPVRLRLEVTDYWGKARVEEHQFYVVEELEPGTDIILGMPWLYTVNPLVD